MFSLFSKKKPKLPVQDLLRRAEGLARKAAGTPSPQVVTALAEVSAALRAWGRREQARRIEQGVAGHEAAVITDDPAALELASAARELLAFEERIRTSFDRDSANEEHFPSTIDPRIYHVKLLLDFLSDLAGKRVLDAGCGKGRFARILKERYSSAEVCGLDISPEMLRHVPEGIKTRQGSLTNLPFPDGHFYGVYAIESLEHAVEIETAVAELCRVTEPGGRIFIIDKNVEKTGQLQTPDWEQWFGRRELEGLLKRHCRAVSSQAISYWEDVPPDGLFLAWKAVK
jgi:SAM-dependent methyltransferase